jgi:FdhE protein
MSEADTKRVRVPPPVATFERRAVRLETLAQGNPAAGWLGLLAGIARGQEAAARDVAVGPVALQREGPPLAFARVPRDGAWRRMLAILLEAADAPTLPAEARGAIARLLRAAPDELERLAARLLAGIIPREELAEATYVGAALQAWFAALASALPPMEVGAARATCPVCGAQPVAGLIEGDSRLRFLSCSLCGAQWNLPRVTCSGCGEEAGLAYYRVEGDAGAAAEACGRCKGYLKVFDAEHRPGADPMADDVATLGLDVLVAEEGFSRLGASPWLAVGA